jgi:hypothetical protein
LVKRAVEFVVRKAETGQIFGFQIPIVISKSFPKPLIIAVFLGRLLGPSVRRASTPQAENFLSHVVVI